MISYIKNYVVIPFLLLSIIPLCGDGPEDINSFKSSQDALIEQHSKEQKENSAREKAEKDALSKEYDSKKKDIEKDRIANKKALKTTDLRIVTKDPYTGKSVSLNNDADVDAFYDKKAKKTNDDYKDQTRSLNEKNLELSIQMREKQEKALNDLSTEFDKFSNNSKPDNKKKNEPTTELGKTVKALHEHKTNMDTIEEKYDNSIDKLQRQYDKRAGELKAKMRSAETTAGFTLPDGTYAKGEKEYNEKTGRVETVNKEAQKYYQDKLDALKTKFEQDKQKVVDAFHDERDAQLKITDDALAKASLKSKPLDTAALKTQLKQANPRTINDFVDRFSNEIIPSLSEKQKDSLKDIVSSIKQEAVNDISFADIIKNNKNDFIEKLHLDKSQQDDLNKNHGKNPKQSITSQKGLWEQLLEFLKTIFLPKPTQVNINS